MTRTLLLGLSLLMLSACNLNDAAPINTPEPLILTEANTPIPLIIEAQTEEAALSVVTEDATEEAIQPVEAQQVQQVQQAQQVQQVQTSANSPNAQTTTCSVNTAWPQYTVQSGDTLFSIARRANSDVDSITAANCLDDPSAIDVGQVLRVPQAITGADAPNAGTILVYYLATDAGPNDEVIGCGSTMVAAQSGIVATNDPAQNIRNALNALFADTQYGQTASGLQNLWAASSGLTVSDVQINGTQANVTITGQPMAGGVCSNPAQEQQLLRTVWNAAPNVTAARIVIGGRTMQQMFDARGDVPLPDVYVRP